MTELNELLSNKSNRLQEIYKQLDEKQTLLENAQAGKKKLPTFIRSSHINPKLMNDRKRTELIKFVETAKVEVNKCIEILWETDPAALPPKHITDQLSSEIGSRMRQVVAKVASATVRSITRKQQKVQWKLDNGWKLKKYEVEILSRPNTPPVWTGSCFELDSRFVSIKPQNGKTKTGDYWIYITIPFKERIQLPIVLTNHCKSLIRKGFTLQLDHLRLYDNGHIDLFFEKPRKHKRIQPTSDIIGVDIGRNKCITTSDGVVESQHGVEVKHKSVKEILAKIGGQKHGSKRNKRTRNHLINQINYSVRTDIDWDKVDVLMIEDIKNLKLGEYQTAEGAAWRYPLIFDAIRRSATETEVAVFAVNPAYTSQTCSICGTIDASARDGEHYHCSSCGYIDDADVNAARNILARGVYSLSTGKIISKDIRLVI